MLRHETYINLTKEKVSNYGHVCTPGTASMLGQSAEMMTKNEHQSFRKKRSKPPRGPEVNFLFGSRQQVLVEAVFYQNTCCVKTWQSGSLFPQPPVGMKPSMLKVKPEPAALLCQHLADTNFSFCPLHSNFFLFYSNEVVQDTEQYYFIFIFHFCNCTHKIKQKRNLKAQKNRTPLTPL